MALVIEQNAVTQTGMFNFQLKCTDVKKSNQNKQEQHEESVYKTQLPHNLRHFYQNSITRQHMSWRDSNLILMFKHDLEVL